MLRLLLLSLVCLLAACGQKGPLFLPTTPVVAPPVAVQPAESIPGSTEETSRSRAALTTENLHGLFCLP